MRLPIQVLAFAAILALLLVGNAGLAGESPHPTSPAQAMYAAGDPVDPCTPESLAGFHPADIMSDIEAAVHPLGEVGKSVSAVLLELPAGKCISVHTHTGASVLYVDEGEVNFVVYQYEPLFGSPIPDVSVEHGVSNGNNTDNADLLGTPASVEPVAFGTPIVLGPGEWVSQNEIVWHSYENIGDSPAVIIIASFAPDPESTPGPGGCHGGCVGRGP